MNQVKLLFQEVERMQSSNNVIKNIQILKLEHKEIITNNYIKSYSEALDGGIGADGNIYPEVTEARLAAKYIIERANLEREDILSKAAETAKEAKTNGYEAGSKQGYNEGYDKAIALAKKDAEYIINNANSILLNSRTVFQKYLEDKKDDIINLSINIAEKILKKEVISADALDNLIYGVIDDSKNAKSFIIKTNSIYTENLKSKVDNWKESLGIKGEIFIVADETIQAGNALVEKNDGKVEVGINVGIEGMRQALS